jgi:coenzyme F420-reducing hydrogenase delta subunit/Pyruvate/2-oxoacid:ferredoxin oxidoreductase delta subunit
VTGAAERLALRLVRSLDAACTRLYGWRRNPLHQSGTLAFALLLVLIVTGLYLLVFYRISAPWASVQRINADPLLGGWIRSLHRYASDAIVLAIAAHALRMLAHARSWGPRALPWISGVFLLLLVFVSGWTGFVLVWDTFGAQLAVAGARLFDALPILSEPLRRIFAGDGPIPSAFFFINLFLHVAIPLAVAAGLWIHVSRLARPTLLPPRALGLVLLAALIAISVALPAPLPPQADPLVVPARVPADLVYAFWLPWTERLPEWAGWAGAVGAFAIGIAIPRLARRPRTGKFTPSVVDERICTGCAQCPQDCPWDAIAMRRRTDGRDTLVAHVDPARCVSCGICAGSCAPMGVGPALRTGRDQLTGMRAFLAEAPLASGVVVLACENAAPAHLGALQSSGAIVRAVPCTGNLHTSVIELALRAGAAGVIVFSCPPRDCHGREGPKWLDQRVYHDREAELQARVDRRRVRLAHMAIGDLAGTLVAFNAFARDVAALGRAGSAGVDEADASCEREPLGSLENGA